MSFYKNAREPAMTALKLTAIGTSTGVVIPQEMLARLRVESGDILYAIEIDGGYLLTPHDPATAEEIKLGKAFMEQYRDAFKALAK
jgi:putative addiction module antidote